MDDAIFRQALRKIEDDEPLDRAEWEALSALVDDRLAQFRALWDRLPVTQRLDLLEAAHAQSEEHAHLDFTPLWYLGLHDSAPRVRALAIACAADEDGQWLIDPLIRLCVGDVDQAVRAAAADALGRFAYLAEVGALPADRGRQIEDALLATYARADEALPVRANALASAGYLSTPRVRETILAALADATLRASAIRAIGRTADPSWLELLLGETASPRAELREEAARALGEIEDERGVSRLLELLDDPVTSVRLAAIWALGAIGGAEAQEGLIYCLEDPLEAVREAAEAALAEIADRNAPLEL
jgi:HEAT repeat protein